MSESPAILDAEAAAAGGFIPAVVGKMGALYGAAVDVMRPLGVFEGVATDFAARWPSTGGELPWQDVWAQMAADDRGSFLLVVQAALEFIASAETPPEDQPWPIEFSAAHVLVDLYVLSERVRGLRRKLVGRDTVDLHGFAEVVWIAMRLGAMSEAFRAEIHGYSGAVEQAKALIKKERDRAERGGQVQGGKAKAAAEAWRKPFLAWLQQEIDAANAARAEPMNLDAVVTHARQNWPAAGFGGQKVPPEASTLRAAIAWGQRQTPSLFTREPAKRGAKKKGGQAGLNSRI